MYQESVMALLPTRISLEFLLAGCSSWYYALQIWTPTGAKIGLQATEITNALLLS
jgi:hypothetical protein